jgi:predicted permease
MGAMIFATIFLGLVPSFLLVGLGGLLRNRLSENAWQGLDKLNFEIFVPALLFVAASGRPIAVGEILRIAPAIWAILTLGLLLGYGARRFGPDRFLDFAGCWQTSWRFNATLAFVAIEIVPKAQAAELAVAVGMAVPVANAFAVAALSHGGSLSLGGMLRKLALNPFLLASLAGVSVGLSGYAVPAPLLTPLSLLAQAAIPVALISIGATMDWSALARLTRFDAALNGVKLLALPGLTLLGCVLLGASPALGALYVMFAALPTASASHILAGAFGADRRIVATLTAQMTLISALTLPFWITLAAMLL